MIAALFITEETYQLYTEIMEDRDRIPMELEDVNNIVMAISDNDGSSKIWYMTPSRFLDKYVTVRPETKTELAVVEPK